MLVFNIVQYEFTNIKMSPVSSPMKWSVYIFSLVKMNMTFFLLFALSSYWIILQKHIKLSFILMLYVHNPRPEWYIKRRFVITNLCWSYLLWYLSICDDDDDLLGHQGPHFGATHNVHNLIRIFLSTKNFTNTRNL